MNSPACAGRVSRMRPSMSGASACAAGDERLIDQRANGSADLASQISRAMRCCSFIAGLIARCFHLLRELASILRGARTFFLRVGEDAEPLEPRALDEVEQVFEFLFGLAGKADDERRADGDAGNAGADACDEVLDVLAATSRGASARASADGCAAAACRCSGRLCRTRRCRR